jgi:cytochrome b561
MSADTAASTASYTRTAVALHWLIAAGIVCAFALGWIMTELAVSPLRLRMFNWHKWLGITLLALALIRVVWRLTHAPPPFLPMPGWQSRLAHTLHISLYGFLLLLPLSGWAYSNAVGYPIVYLGKVRLPDLVEKNKELGETLLTLHEVLGWLLLLALALHVAGALKHHFVDRDATLRRMSFTRQPAAGAQQFESGSASYPDSKAEV